MMTFNSLFRKELEDFFLKKSIKAHTQNIGIMWQIGPTRQPLTWRRPVLAYLGGRPAHSVDSPRAPRNTGLEAPGVYGTLKIGQPAH